MYQADRRRSPLVAASRRLGDTASTRTAAATAALYDDSDRNTPSQPDSLPLRHARIGVAGWRDRGVSVFRGLADTLIKTLWHGRLGLSLSGWTGASHLAGDSGRYFRCDQRYLCGPSRYPVTEPPAMRFRLIFRFDRLFMANFNLVCRGLCF